jgi:hypothetical protein
MYVDAVKKWTADFVQIPYYLPRGTYTCLGRMVVVSAWTWIHGCDEHEVTGVIDTVLDTADCNMVVLQWLAKHLECASLELG